MRPESLFDIFASVTSLSGVGKRMAESLERFAGERVVDLCWHLPTGILNRQSVDNLHHAKVGEIITIPLRVIEHRPPQKAQRKLPYRVGCKDSSGNTIDLVFFHGYESYLTPKLPIGKTVLVSGKLDKYYDSFQITHPDYMGDVEKRKDWQGAEPAYPLTKGITQKYLHKLIKIALDRCQELPEWLSTEQLAQEKWSAWQESLVKVHHPHSETELLPNQPARRRLAYDELLANQLGLLLVRQYHHRKLGRAFKTVGKLAEALLPHLPFELTNAQKKALQEIYNDLDSENRMVRLLHGDVGSGKTIVAMLAMLHVIESGSQTALLAPTEILAQQHANTIAPWAEAVGINVGLLTSKGKGRTQTLEELASGKIDLIVGTHALIQEQVQFKDLGLAVIDEQHRFGVEQRLSLTAKGENVYVVVMTATPIPRTLLLAVYGDLDTSRLDEKPAGRQEVITKTMSLSRLDEVIAGIKRAVKDGHKIFWVCPLIEESEVLDLSAAEDRLHSLESIFPGQVGLLHGRMRSVEKDAVMADFLTGKLRVLVATTVIEVGVHVPDATIMVVEHAERFGLAQLHQLRGRIGRGEEESKCLLLYDSPLTQTARSRLKIMRETSDGFKIAEEDLRLRGGGDILGLRQSGLPNFRLVDYEFHADLLALAHHDAEQIIQMDPSLTSERGKALKTLLYLFNKDSTVEYLQ